MSFFKKKHKNITNPQLKNMLLDLDNYLDSHYLLRRDSRYQGIIGKLKAGEDKEKAENRENSSSEQWRAPPAKEQLGRIYGADSYGLEDALERQFQTEMRKFEMRLKYPFYYHVLRHMEKKGLDIVSIYKKARLDRKLFSKIKTRNDYIPSKKTILALAIAMELSLEETQRLLKKGG